MLSTNLFQRLSPRLFFSLVCLLCVTALGTAIYSQYFNGADPCPLCIAQRIVYFAIGIISLVAAIHNPKKWGNAIYGIFLLGLVIFGIKIAYHHVWLQSLPPSEWPASCGMPLEILYKKVPLSGFIHTILSGSAECAMVTWKVWGISAPLISLSGYIICGLGTLLALLSGYLRNNRVS